MSAIKRYMEDECQKLADKYGYPWDIVMDALNYTEYDWERVELMAKARVLALFVTCKMRKEEAYEKINSKTKTEDSISIFEDIFGIKNG